MFRLLLTLGFTGHGHAVPLLIKLRSSGVPEQCVTRVTQVRNDLSNPVHCYVDESIQQQLGFVATAFVFSSGPLEPSVAGILKSHGLSPGIDEFKSGARMDADPTLRHIREEIFRLVGSRSRLAVVFSLASRRDSLGRYALQALQSVIVRNAVPQDEIQAYFDQGIFPRASSVDELQRFFPALAGAVLHGGEDSRQRMGLQVADAVAHTFGQVLRESLTGDTKPVSIGPTDDDRLPLSDLLLSPVRHSIFRRPIIYGSHEYDPVTDPIVCTSEDELLQLGPDAEALGWGVQVAPDLPDKYRRAVRAILERVWLGCYH